MKYCRFQKDRTIEYGLVESVAGRDTITAIISPPEHNAELWPRPISRVVLDDTQLLAPVQPSKIVCVGRNYREHAKELGHEVPSEPLIFLKPPSSLLGPGQAIVRPQISTRVDYEGELGVVIGTKCRHVSADECVQAYILGYTCVNDVTARDLQKKDGQWTRGKGFDTFCAVGPCLAPKEEIDFASLRVR